MDRRWLLPLAAGTSGLLALAAIASRGRPLTGRGRGAGPAASFYDYLFTSLLIVGVVLTLLAVWALLGMRDARRRRAPTGWHLVATLVGLAATLAAIWLLVHSGVFDRLRPVHLPSQGLGAGGQSRTGTVPPVRHARDVRVRWSEIAVVLALAAGALVLLVATRLRQRPSHPPSVRAEEELSLALDESLDDLLAEPDLRKAIVAAYARMEGALARAGLPRRASEAPFEYVERALASLDASAASARRLTSLFEWAKFSRHEPEPHMRDEAIAALVAVRDELRPPVEAVA